MPGGWGVEEALRVHVGIPACNQGDAKKVCRLIGQDL